MLNGILYQVAFTMKDVLKLKNQLCFPLYALSREVVNRYRPFLDELDITYPQYLVLMVLWENDLQTVNQLGEKLRLDTGTLTPLLKRMETKGLLLRTRKSSDERVVEVGLTQAGKKLKEKAKDIPSKLAKAMGLTQEEISQLKNIVNKILAKSTQST